MSKHCYIIEFNGERLSVDEPELSGAQIRALFAVDAAWNLVIERAGAEADVLLNDDQVVSLRDGPVRVFSMPPTAFGDAIP